VVEVHDLHIWQITSGMTAASAHVLVGPGLDCHAVRVGLETLLAQTYQIGHATLQVDHAPEQMLSIGHAAADSRERHCARSQDQACRPGSEVAGEPAGGSRADKPVEINQTGLSS